MQNAYRITGFDILFLIGSIFNSENAMCLTEPF